MALGKCRNGRDKFRQRGAEGNHRQTDNGRRNAQSLSDQRTVIDKKLSSDSNQNCAERQKDDVLPHGVFRFRAFLRNRIRRGRTLHLDDVDDNLGDKHGK